MKFHEGGKKIERVINVYMNVWVISHPRRSARGNVVLHSWVYPIDSLGYYQKRNRRRGKIEPPTENLDDVMAKSPNRSHGRFGTLTIWVHYQALCYGRQALTSSSDSWFCLIVFFFFFFYSEWTCMHGNETSVIHKVLVNVSSEHAYLILCLCILGTVNIVLGSLPLPLFFFSLLAAVLFFPSLSLSLCRLYDSPCCGSHGVLCLFMLLLFLFCFYVGIYFAFFL